MRPGFALSSEITLGGPRDLLTARGAPPRDRARGRPVKILSPQEILARLESPLDFLTGGARDLPARQQTLRNAIAWSADLDADERRLFRRLGVFEDGFTVDAAAAVAGQAPDAPARVLDTLESLLDKSLLARALRTGERVATRDARDDPRVCARGADEQRLQGPDYAQPRRLLRGLRREADTVTMVSVAASSVSTKTCSCASLVPRAWRPRRGASARRSPGGAVASGDTWPKGAARSRKRCGWGKANRRRHARRRWPGPEYLGLPAITAARMQSAARASRSPGRSATGSTSATL